MITRPITVTTSATRPTKGFMSGIVVERTLVNRILERIRGSPFGWKTRAERTANDEVQIEEGCPTMLTLLSWPSVFLGLVQHRLAGDLHYLVGYKHHIASGLAMGLTSFTKIVGAKPIACVLGFYST